MSACLRDRGPRREDGDDDEGLAGVAPDFTAHLDGMIAERRAASNPPDDFITRLIDTEVDGERLTDLEMRTQLAFLLMSGNETTRHLIGNMLETVCSDPALYARLRASAPWCRPLVEESLRHDPPIHVLMRDCLARHHGRRRHDPGRREGGVRPRLGEPRRATPTTIPTSSGWTDRARGITSRLHPRLQAARSCPSVISSTRSQ